MGGNVVDNQGPVLVGVSPAIRQVFDLLGSVARSACPVLIEGESGTGKELVARRLHAIGPRARQPFMPVNCAGISEALFESQFFGHVRGAFTGAQQTMLGLVRIAAGGTLFLDEIGEVPSYIQPKLLRVLQDGEVLPVGSTAPVAVDVRFIAATNRRLSEDVCAGRFRQDLFYRLNVVRISLPPLRQRPEDVGVLLDHFLTLFAEEYACSPVVLSDSVQDQLAAYPWPGNVRELASWVERLYVTGFPAEALVSSLLAELHTMPVSADSAADAVFSLKDAERRAIRRALGAAGQNQNRAARLLDIHRSTLARKLREFSVA